MTNVAIITGAGRGIGRATAVLLAQSGYACVCVSRSQGDVDETARLAGNGSIGVAGDVCDADRIESVVRLVRERFGRIDALVNNAGVAPLIPFGEMTDAVWDEVIDPEHAPASSAVQVAALVRPEFLVEIEAFAIVPEEPAP